jgi:cobalt-zinc-cadmium resistance protein CzcA
MDYYYVKMSLMSVWSCERFGAITGNGGEKVLGRVMMLKGANSKQK